MGQDDDEVDAADFYVSRQSKNGQRRNQEVYTSSKVYSNNKDGDGADEISASEY